MGGESIWAASEIVSNADIALDFSEILFFFVISIHQSNFYGANY
jgi:hypothetical protein